MTEERPWKEPTFDEEYRETTQSVTVLPIDTHSRSKRSAAFIVIGGRSFGKSYNLDREENVLGRAPSSDVRIDDDGVSRQHAKVVRAEDQWVLIDLESTNGTYHDGERIQILTLQDGDKVHVGLGTILRFQFQDVMDELYQRSMYESKTRDALTDIYNRAYFMEALEREVGFGRRHGQVLSLLLFDIDHFKRVNDTYGHQAGDLVLKQVAKAIAEIMRKEDVFARYGGEEFAVLLRNTASERAFILAERIRRCVERLEIVHDGRRIPVTVSVGVANTSEQLKISADLIAAADQRLYEAKRRGRNRTEAGIFD